MTGFARRPSITHGVLKIILLNFTKNKTMYKTIIMAGLVMLSSFSNNNNNDPVKKKTIHQFKVEALDGSTIDFSKFKGKKILRVVINY